MDLGFTNYKYENKARNNTPHGRLKSKERECFWESQIRVLMENRACMIDVPKEKKNTFRRPEEKYRFGKILITLHRL